MKANPKPPILLIASIAAAGGVIVSLHAQTAPPVYVIVDFSEFTDAQGFSALPPKASPERLASFGGKYIVRSDKISALDGIAPKRFVAIEFDSMDHAKAWKAAPTTAEIDVIRAHTTKSRPFIVEI